MTYQVSGSEGDKVVTIRTDNRLLADKAAEGFIEQNYTNVTIEEVPTEESEDGEAGSSD